MGRLACLLITVVPLHGIRQSSLPSLSRANNRFVAEIRKMASANEAASSLGLSDIGGARSDGLPADESMLTWRRRIETSIARSRKVRGANYVQLATVDLDTMLPRCRTVVFRGFQRLPESQTSSPDGMECEDMSCAMKMITDSRSNKVLEATKHPGQAAEIVWWFAKSSEQYRMQGKLEFVGTGKFALDDNTHYTTARKEQWGNLSDPAREQFFWQAPGLPYSGESTVPTGGRDAEGNLLPPPDNFILMILIPSKVDYLRLGDNFRQVDELVSGAWVQARLNP